MAGVDATSLTAGEWLGRAKQAWEADEPRAALAAAWTAFDLAPRERASKAFLAMLLEQRQNDLPDSRRDGFLRLLTDREVEPNRIAKTGWRWVLRRYPIPDPVDDSALVAALTAFERDDLVLALLREAPVCLVEAERILSRLRCYLLLSGCWRAYPQVVNALKAQIALNGGAWPFNTDERHALMAAEAEAMVAAYLPVGDREVGSLRPELSPTDRITPAVRAQYETWPYPAWTRVTLDTPRRLPDTIAALDVDVAAALPVKAAMLVAGCGTGRQAAYVASQYPDATVTAIDISEASLDYGRRQCAALGIANVRFLRLDLHRIAELGRRFHAIHSAGVLHHVANPERGLKLLADVLEPGGVMHLMLYNRHQRLMVNGAKALLMADLLHEPVSDDLLRRVRQRFLDRPDHPAAAYVMRSRDFFTLAGAHDLLLHRHEDPFDLPRLDRALAAAGLLLLSFDMPTPAVAARYRAMFPHDPKRRDIKSFDRFETHDPAVMHGHYRFWCYLPNARD